MNIIPIIAKADTIAKNELHKFKSKIMSELVSNGVQIYQFPTDEETVAEINATMSVSPQVGKAHPAIFLKLVSAAALERGLTRAWESDVFRVVLLGCYFKSFNQCAPQFSHLSGGSVRQGDLPTRTIISSACGKGLLPQHPAMQGSLRKIDLCLCQCWQAYIQLPYFCSWDWFLPFPPFASSHPFLNH